MQNRRRRIRDSRRATVFTLGGRRTPSVIPETRPRLYLAASVFLPPLARSETSLSSRISLHRDLSFSLPPLSLSRKYDKSLLQRAHFPFLNRNAVYPLCVKIVRFTGFEALPRSEPNDKVHSLTSLKQNLIKTSRHGGFSTRPPWKVYVGFCSIKSKRIRARV